MLLIKLTICKQLDLVTHNECILLDVNEKPPPPLPPPQSPAASYDTMEKPMEKYACPKNVGASFQLSALQYNSATPHL
jgi:hypothetical protein